MIKNKFWAGAWQPSAEIVTVPGTLEVSGRPGLAEMEKHAVNCGFDGVNHVRPELPRQIPRKVLVLGGTRPERHQDSIGDPGWQASH
jgi:hypothetical protein